MNIDRSLFIRSNRSLGLALVQAGLLAQQDLDLANAKLIDCVRADELKGSGLLPILTHDMGVLSEAKLLQYQTEEHNLGLIDPDAYQIHPTPGIDPTACWATWTMPVDERDGIHFLATAYYLSQPARTHWEQAIKGPIVWYGASLQTMINAMDKLATQEGVLPAR